MKETGWKKTAGNGSDGKRTEGKKSFGRGEKTTGFSKNSAKVGVNGEKQGKSARKVSGVEDKWGTHGDRKRNVGEKDGQKTVRGGQRGKTKCPIYRECGGCQYLHLTYDQQLKEKQKRMEELLGGVCPVRPIIGMEEPYHYRNKVHAVFGLDRKNNPISGIYKEGTHRILPVDSCLIEDQKADEIIVTIRSMLRSFKIRVFDEDTGYGLLRHVLIRRGFTTGEILVVLVTASPVFPSKNNFVKALREKHPEITTIVQNINGRNTSMVLGDKEHVLYGKGYIEDELCGLRFRISSRSFYQINSVQTEKLYGKAMELAELTGKETVLDAYCGIGTIGLIASKHAGKVIGVELNQDAVRDAVQNAKKNGITRTEIAEIITHIGFYAGWPKAWAAFNLAKGVWSEDIVGEDAKTAFQREMIFPIGEPNTAYAQYFIGNSYLAPVSREQVNISNVTFEPRCRNNWHIHRATKGGGQMLIGVAGRGWYQEEGKPAVEILPGTVIHIPANVKHWHGAAADSWFAHLAFEVSGENTSNEWLEPVTDDEYNKLEQTKR